MNRFDSGEIAETGKGAGRAGRAGGRSGATRRFFAGLSLAALAAFGAGGGIGAPAIAADAALAAPKAAPQRQVLLTPDVIVDKNGRSVEVERGLILVPENRRDPKSRMITVHFLRAKALNPSGRPPVVQLPGGPGSEYDFTKPGYFDRIDRYRQTRDYIYVSQRGNPRAPGLSPAMKWRLKPGQPLNKPGSVEANAKAAKAAYKAAIEQWTDAGVDLSGYDIYNIVDDVYELRAALGYDKIVLRGCSFGSQWSFSYIKRWPETVDRAMLSGVEPLDYAYDSPDGLWNSMTRLAEAAEADADLAPSIPEGGLMKALQTVFERLEKKPQKVTLPNPLTGQPVEVVVGPADLANVATSVRRFLLDTDTENLAQWPRMVIELYNGDYRFLAANAMGERMQGYSSSMIGLLIDNSLGISDERDKALQNEAAARWLSPNTGYIATRDISPAPEVEPSFRDDFRLTMPVLLFSGDYDWSTPVESAEHAAKFLDNGRFVKVEGATHCPAAHKNQMPTQRKAEMEKLIDFIDADFEKKPASAFFDTLPAKITLDPIDFAVPGDTSLFEEWLGRAKSLMAQNG